MIPEINVWAVLMAALSTILVGAIWYAPKVFGNYWMRVAEVQASGNPKDVIRPILITLVASYISAWILAGTATIVQNFYGGSFLVSSLVTAIVLWAGFTACRFIAHDAFESRPIGLTVLNCVHELVTFVVMALIIGLLGVNGA
ncbi:MAG TPA: DUF1761 domain-containing protein [Arthrobacter sp.]|nr:DUF1761 domain-containing protein [Arthrobacter sp.]